MKNKLHIMVGVCGARLAVLTEICTETLVISSQKENYEKNKRTL